MATLVVSQLLLWAAPVLRGWDTCDSTGGFSPRTGGMRTNLRFHVISANLSATVGLVQALLFRYLHARSGDDTPVMWRVWHVVLASWIYMLIYTVEEEVIWCWPGKRGDIIAAFILPVSLLAEAVQRALFMRAIRKRVKLTEMAFETELGARTILRSWKVVVVTGALVAVTAAVGAWAFAGDKLKEEEMGKINSTAYAIFESVSSICQLVTAIVAISALSRVRSGADEAALDGPMYVRAEAAWAVNVLRRVQVATAGPCLVDAMTSGFVAAASFLIHKSVAADLPHAGERQGIAVLVATVVPVLLDSLGLFLIVGMFQPRQPKINMEDVRTSPCAKLGRSGPSFELSDAWHETVEDLAYRSIELVDLLDLYDELLEGCDEMPHYDPLRSTTNDVVRQFVIPRSRVGDGGQAYAVVVGRRRIAPDRMVTHCWDNPFLFIVGAAVADAMQLNVFGGVARELAEEGTRDIRRRLRERGTVHMAFWVCALCVNQHAHICQGSGPAPPEGTEDYDRWDAMRRDTVTKAILPACNCSHPKYTATEDPAQCELNKFDDVMGLMTQDLDGIRHLVIGDREFKIFSRAWCVAELVESYMSDMPVDFCVQSPNFMNVLGDLDTYTKVVNVSVLDCHASRAEDREFILSKIPDTDRFNAQLQKIIFGQQGLLGQKFEGFGLVEAAVRVARRTSHAVRVRGATSEGLRPYSALARSPA